MHVASHSINQAVVQEELPPLNKEQQQVLEAVLAGQSLFFSGCAGMPTTLSQRCKGCLAQIGRLPLLQCKLRSCPQAVVSAVRCLLLLPTLCAWVPSRQTSCSHCHLA